MTLAKRNRTNSDIDDRTERECVARGKVAILNQGIIPLRWVDVMPLIVARDLLAEVRAARANHQRDMSGAAAAQTAAVSRWALTPEKRAYSCCSGFDFFDTQEEAEQWVIDIEQDDEICPDAILGACFVARVVSRSEFIVTERREDDPENWSHECDEAGYLRFAAEEAGKGDE